MDSIHRLQVVQYAGYYEQIIHFILLIIFMRMFDSTATSDD